MGQNSRQRSAFALLIAVGFLSIPSQNAFSAGFGFSTPPGDSCSVGVKIGTCQAWQCDPGYFLKCSESAIPTEISAQEWNQRLNLARIDDPSSKAPRLNFRVPNDSCSIALKIGSCSWLRCDQGVAKSCAPQGTSAKWAPVADLAWNQELEKWKNRDELSPVGQTSQARQEGVTLQGSKPLHPADAGSGESAPAAAGSGAGGARP